jgi:putative NADPH-quinone reductase
MQVSVILGHPDPKSFNHAIAETAVEMLKRNGHLVIFHDLYVEKFDPVISADEIPDRAALPDFIQTHCDEIAAADGIVIVHPNWWGQPPAIIKGWIDRVLRVGTAYRFLEGDDGEGIPLGLLKAKAVLIFNTSNTPVEREQNVFGDPLQNLWKNCIFELCGVPVFHREMFGVVCTSTLDERRGWLNRVRDAVNQHFYADDRGENESIDHIFSG